MRYVLISDDEESLRGLRLAGIAGIRVADSQGAMEALALCAADPEIALVLITEKLKASCLKELYAFMLEHSAPIIVGIPGSDDAAFQKTDMQDYIRNAVGLKV